MGRLEKSLALIKILFFVFFFENGVSTILQLVVAHKDTGQQA